MIRLTAILGLFGISFLGPPGLPAQTTPGNIAVITGTNLLEVSPPGAVSTIVAMPAGQTAIGICPSIDNLGVAVLTQAIARNTTTIRVLEVKNGQLTTVASTRKTTLGTLFPVIQGGIVPEQRGHYVIASPLGIHRVAGIGSNPSTLSTTSATGLCDALSTGGWLTFANNAVAILTRTGQRTQVARIGGSIPIGRGSITTDTTTGNAFVAQGALHAVNLTRMTITTLSSGGPMGSALAVDIDPRDRSLIVGSNTGLFRADRQGTVACTLATGFKAVGVTVIGSNHISGYSLPSLGVNYSVFVSFPHPGFYYVLGASLAYAPGIPTPYGTIPLGADSLFFLSRTASSVFIRFSGQLDAAGRATAAVAVPKAPIRGVRFFLAGLEYDSRGKVLIISEPVGVTVE